MINHNGTKTDSSLEQNKKIPEMSAHLNWKLIYDKRGKFIQWGKDSLNKQLWENCKAICKGMKLEKIFLSLKKETQNALKA